MRNAIIALLPIIMLAVLSATSDSLAIGQEFRIETGVFRGNSEEPISENLTLFSGNLIFDFMLPTAGQRFPEEIVIFQSRERKFVLLDTTRRVKTYIVEGEVLKILAAMKSSDLVNESNAFLFTPQFKEDYDVASGWLTLQSKQLSYKTRGERPKNDLVLHKYYEFIDQFSRLNVTDPRRMPPFARLELNSALKKYGFIPKEVQVSLIPSLDPPSEPIQLKTTHSLMWEISEKDKQRIASAKRYWMEFKEVSLSDFRQLQQAEVAESESATEDR